MAQDITLLGASYSSVPAVELPKTGGGTAKFADPSGVTASAADVASGKYFLDSTGELVTGTASGGGGSAVIEPLAVTANGTYMAPSGVDGYSPVTVNVQGGGGSAGKNDVNFIDYDGTILYSYSVSDFMALTEPPANPTHTGLTAQGWNWTMAQAKAQLTAMPEAGLTIGQMYVTDDGTTRIYCRFKDGRLAPYLGLGIKGTVAVDWGDGSATDTLTGTSLTTVKTVQHNYAAAGDYAITLTVTSGSFSFFGVTSAAHILKKSTAVTINISRIYANAVQRVELGENAEIGTYAFNYCSSLASITIPSGVTSIGTYAFNHCYSLASITIPSGVTSIGNYTFSYCYSLASITIPSGVTSIGSYAFNYCYSLAAITVPNGITIINNYAFSYCYGLASIILGGVTSIGNNAFNYCSSLASITIPSGVTSIGTYAFQNCYSLSSIAIPSGVTSIRTYAFQNCYGLASITIPSGITSISSYAFSYCYGLGEIHFLPTAPPTVSSNAWSNIPTDCVIYVPSGTLAAYTSATNYPSSDTYTYVEE